ncbi:MAG: hypothetical protein ACK41Y_16280, partial [Paracoccus hibiscisoli]|uniref:hypothetical protein n=1 Tax=Paracoccus hibiscisoli TaxID=2023261 RepID=UPI00391DAB8C
LAAEAVGVGAAASPVPAFRADTNSDGGSAASAAATAAPGRPVTSPWDANTVESIAVGKGSHTDAKIEQHRRAERSGCFRAEKVGTARTVDTHAHVTWQNFRRSRNAQSTNGWPEH